MCRVLGCSHCMTCSTGELYCFTCGKAVHVCGYIFACHLHVYCCMSSTCVPECGKISYEIFLCVNFLCWNYFVVRGNPQQLNTRSVFNFHGLTSPRKYFSNKHFPKYGIAHYTQRMLRLRRYSDLLVNWGGPFIQVEDSSRNWKRRCVVLSCYGLCLHCICTVARANSTGIYTRLCCVCSQKQCIIAYLLCYFPVLHID